MLPVSESIKCLLFDLTNKSRTIQFIVLSSTVLFFHITQGYMHELIFRLPGFKPFSMFLTLLQFLFYALLALIETIVSDRFKFNLNKNRKYVLIFYFYEYKKLISITLIIKT
jgi:hypothetical protein